MFNLKNITKISFFAVVISAPIQWISIMNVGSLSIKFVHLSIVPILLCLLFPDFRNTIARFFHFNRWMIFCFLLLMVANFVFTCLNATNQDIGFSYIAKNLSYLLYFIAFGAILFYECSNINFHKDIAISNFICLLTFLFMAELIFLALGRNFISEIVSDFIRGDSVAIRYDIFYKLFNAQGVAGDAEYQTNLRNTLLGAFIYVHFTSLYSLKASSKNYLKTINWFNICFSAFFIIASTSRSNMVVLVLGYLIFIFLSAYSNQLRIKPYHIFLGMVGAFLIIILMPKLESFFGDSTSMISSRLSQLDDDARWDLDGEALTYFENNLAMGKGAGAVLSDGHRVHNFILGSAYQAGFIGFFLSAIFYFYIIYKVFRAGKLVGEQKNLYWFASLTSLPLLRAMTSGNSGTLTIIEWFALAFFFCILMLSRENSANHSFNPIQYNKFLNTNSQEYV